MPRVETPVTFTAAEAAHIKGVIRSGSPDLCCPRCVQDLAFGPSVMYEGHVIRELYCPTCHRCLMLRDVDPSSDRDP